MLVVLQCLIAPGLAPVEVGVRPAFGGWFRAGLPVAVFVEVKGGALPFEGKVTVTMGGVGYSRGIRVAPGGSVSRELVVPAWVARPTARLSVSDPRGRQVAGRLIEVPLARVGDERLLVAVVGDDRPWGEMVCGPGFVVVAGEPLPTSASGYLSLDALLVRGDGASLPRGCGVEQWARGGGQVVFVLDPEEAIGRGCLLASLVGGSVPAKASEWLARHGGSEGRGAWSVGLGRAAVVLSPAARPEVVAGLLLPRKPDALADERLFGAFPPPRWPTRLRWRLVVAPVALMLLGVVVARAVARGRWAGTVALGACGVLAAGATAAVFLPGGRTVVRVARVVERGGGYERATDLVCVDGLGRSSVELVLRGADAVLPLGFGAGVGGSGDVERMSADAWVLRADVERGSRQCFVVVGRVSPAGRGVARRAGVVVCDGRLLAGGGPERPLSELVLWDGFRGALVEWQARRSRPGSGHEVAWEGEGWAIGEVEGRGIAGAYRGPTLVWTWRRPAGQR